MTSITLLAAGTRARIVYVALEEIGHPFEVQTLNAFNGDMQSPEFKEFGRLIVRLAKVIGVGVLLVEHDIGLVRSCAIA